MKKIFSAINVRVYWWNFGRKTLDSRTDNAWSYFQEKGITVTRISRKGSELKGFRFRVSTSSSNVVLDSYSFPEVAAMDAIKLYLSLMGDKAEVNVGHRTYKMNWR